MKTHRDNDILHNKKSLNHKKIESYTVMIEWESSLKRYDIIGEPKSNIYFFRKNEPMGNTLEIQEIS